MLFNEIVELKIDNKLLIVSSDLKIEEKVKYGIIGPNGVGKTTLMNHIYDKIKNNAEIVYVNQIEPSHESITIFDYMLMTDIKLHDMYKQFTVIENENNDDNIDKYNELLNELTDNNFDQYKANIYKILNGLGFHDDGRKINTLSGGQFTKLSLGKALLLSPTLLLLDEPTNHLDLHNVLWLEEYLTEYKKAFIVISHNINFIDTTCQKIVYFYLIDPIKPQIFTCNGDYSNFVKIYEQKKKEYINAYDKYVRKIEQLKKKNTPENKNKLAELIKKEHINRPTHDVNILIQFNEVKALSNFDFTNIISFTNVSFSYGEKIILRDVNIGISMKSRYVLIGNNGAGKSTFFKLCIGELVAQIGTIEKNTKLVIGYFGQRTINEMPQELNAIEYIQLINKTMEVQSIIYALSKVGFTKHYGDDKFDIKKLLIANMSGGQKVKLAFCGIKLQNPHLILFDEPTNHLDILSIEQFINSINSYNGGIVIITHDKYIIEKIKNYELITLVDGIVTKYNGTFDDYCDSLTFE